MNMPFISLIGSGVKWEGGGGDGDKCNPMLVFMAFLSLLETGAIYVEPEFTPTKQNTEYLSNRVKYTAFLHRFFTQFSDLSPSC